MLFMLVLTFVFLLLALDLMGSERSLTTVARIVAGHNRRLEYQSTR